MNYFTDLLPSILAQYHKLHDLRNVPIKVDLLRPLIEARGYADRIFFEEFNFPSQIVIAKVEFYRGSMGVYAGAGNYARVQYSGDLNYCWSRFAILKEMYHCILDKSVGNRVTDIAGLMKLGQMLVSEAYASLEDFAPFKTEELAEILAMETLFPMELRCFYKDAYDKGQISNLQLALRYRIPERYVRLAMLKGYYQVIYDARVNSFVKLD